ncbi:retention module-containing protein [Deefgea piscis]|uniref:retention module-containing protein n=1 Tax=Deefgea piscis TaxID=2739061 RepID=UPI001C814141|nr:retention module-containing protein [Deefgea piscis]QZA81615.1 retention module-containing protein [Deefgea piscis]
MAEQIIAANSGAKQQIVVVQGEAFIKDARGQLQAIKAGDVLLEGQVIVTDAQGHLTVLLPNGQIIELGADRSLLIDGDLLGTAPTDSTEAAVAKTNDSADQIINALNEGKDLTTDLEATAAGLGAGGGTDEGSGFVRLMRVAEGVDPLSFNFATALDTFEPPPSATFADVIAAEIIADNKNPEFVDANNAPLGNDQAATTPEDTPVSGKLLAKDDNGDPLVFNKTSDPTHGTVVVDVNGNWTYTPNKDYTGPDSFQVQVSDGKGGTDTITVNVGVTPVNDPALINGAQQGEVTEDVAVVGNEIKTQGQLTITDPDAGEAVFQTQNTTGKYGQFAVNAAGLWTYTVDNSQGFVQGLDDKETLTESFTVLSKDGTPVTITVVVNGTNDAPVATAATLSVKEDDAVVNGQLIATDVDVETLTFAAKNPLPAGLTLNADGSYTFDPTNPAYNSLKAGEELKITVPYTVTDGTVTVDSTLSLTITGTNDKPVVTPPTEPVPPTVNFDPNTGTYTHNVPEDTVVIGKVNGADVDGDTLTFTQASNPANGKVVVNADGSYTYTPNLDYIGSDSFTVTVSDGKGGTALATVNINLTPASDPAIIGGVKQGEVTEDVAVVGNEIKTQGQLTITDPDAGEAVFQTQNTTGKYGQFAVNAAGLWTYTVDNSQGFVQGLDDKETLTESFTVLSKDGTPVTITVVVNGTNDAPVATAATLSVKEDDAVVNGQLIATDVDVETLTFAAKNPLPAGLTLNADGSYTFDPTNPAYNSLKAGEELKITVPYTVTDGTVTVDSTLSLTITGTNDKPVVTPPTEPVPPTVNFDPNTGTYTHNVPEDTVVIGKVNGADVDGDTLTFTQASNPANGKVVVNADGSYTYTPNLDYIGSDSFTVTVSDGKGGTALATVNINLTPASDPAIIGGVKQGEVTEDVAVVGNEIKTQGQLTITDPDAGEAVFQTQNTTGKYGQFAVNAAGLWTYTVDNSQGFVQGLDDKETLTESFTVLSKDGTPVTITVVVNGTNDAPVATAATLSVKEDDAVVNGQLIATDVDVEKLTFAAKNPLPAGLTLNPDGSYTFDPTNPAYNSLKAGEELKITVPYTVTDGTVTVDSTLSLTITGTNDKPVVTPPTEPVPPTVNFDPNTGTYTHNVPEDTVVIGKVNGADVDGDTLTFTQASNPANGKVVVNADGSYTYTPNLDYIGSDSFTVTVSDGKGGTALATVNINLTPASDPAIIGGVKQGEVTEDVAVVGNEIKTQGQLTITDPDAGEAVFQTQNTTGKYGQFAVNAAGLWTYTVDNSQGFVQGLDDKETLTESFTVLSKDGTPVTITVVVNGTNDAPVATAATLSVKEDDAVVNGQLIATDVDVEKLTFAAKNPLPAGLTLNPDGSYTFDPTNPAYNSLKAGEELKITVPYTVTDGTVTVDSTLSLTITGTNDKPVVTPPTEPVPPTVNFDPNTGTYTHNVPEDTVVIGKVNGADVDGDTLTFTQASNPANGKVVVNADGSYTYTPNLDYIGSDSFTVTVSDGKGGTALATVNINLTPASDPAIIGGVKQGEVTEDVAVVGNEIKTQGQLTITDPDAGEAVFQTQNTTGKYGQFAVNAAGLWTYTVDNSQGFVQGLDDKETLTESFTVLSKDGTPVTITVVVNGTNDAPVATAATLSVKEDDAVVNGQLIATDVDVETLTFAAKNPLPAGLTLNADGSYTFDPTNPAYNSLKAGEELKITVPYTVTDGTVTVDSTLSLTITGTNDKPVVTPPTEPVPPTVNFDPNTGTYTHNVPEDTVVIGKVNGADVDGDTLTFTQASNPANGKVVVNADGSYTYTPNLDYIGSDSFTVTVSDGKGGTALATVNINLTPASDPAIIGGVKQGEVTEDVAVVGNEIKTQGQLTITDPDAGEAVFQTQNTTGKYGQFAVNAAGLWTYTVDNSQGFVQGLDDKETLTESFTVLSKDGTPVTITVVVNGTNDAPVATAATLSVKEDDAVVNGQLIATDVDVETLTFAAKNPLPAGLTLNADGSYTFDPTNPAYNSLKAGEELKITVPYTVTDGTVTVDSTLSLTITGTNDKPVVTPPTEPVPPTVNFDPNTGTYTHNVPEDTVVIGKVNGADVDGDTLTFTQASNPANGKVVVNADGSYTYTPNLDYIGSDSFTVTVSDGKGGTALATVNINLTPASDPAIIGGVKQGEVTEDVAVVGNEIKTQGQLTITDPDAGEAVFQTQNTTGKYGQFAVNAAGLWTYTVDNSQGFVQGLDDKETLTESFTVLSKDGTPVTITVVVNGTNDAPVATAATLSVKEDDAVVNGQLIATDVDVETLTFAAKNPLPAGLTLNADGSYTFDPTNPAYNSLKAGEELKITVPYTVTDGTVTVDSTLSLTITGTNDKPVVTPPTEPVPPTVNFDPNTGTYTHNVPEDTVVIGKVNGADVDGDTLTFTQASNPANGKVVVNADGSYTYTPNLDYIGSDSFTVTVSDGKGGTALATVNINLTPVDDASVLRADSQTVLEDTPAKGNVLANDSDVDSALTVATFSVDGRSYTAGQTATIANVGTLTISSTGEYTFTPAPNWNGAMPQATYVTNTGSSSTLNVTVNPVDDASVLRADSQTVLEDTPAKGNVLTNDSDVDSALTVTSFSIGGSSYTAGQTATIANVGTLTISSTGEYTFTPAPNWNGAMPQATYVTNTGSSSTLNVTVNPVDDASVLRADSQTVLEDTPAKGNVLTNDSDVDSALTVTSFSIGGSSYTAGQTATIANVGTLTISSTGEYTFTPAPNWNGAMPQATYVTNTGSSSTLNVTVNPVDDASVLRADSQTVLEDTPAKGNVLTNDSDVDSALTVTSFSIGGSSYTAGQTATIANVGTLTISSTGEYTFTPAPNWNGAMPQATYVTNTGSSSTLNVTVNPVDDAPTLDLDASMEDTSFKTTYVENGSGTPIADIDSVIGDVDSTNLVSFSPWWLATTTRGEVSLVPPLRH